MLPTLQSFLFSASYSTRTDPRWTPCPTHIPTPVPTITYRPTPVPTPSPSPLPSSSPTNLPTPTPTTPEPSAVPTLPPSPAPSFTAPPTISQFPTPAPTMTYRPTPLPTLSPTPAPTPTPTPSPTLSPEVLVNLEHVRVAEGGGLGEVKVWLSNRPIGDVYVKILSRSKQVYLNVSKDWDDDDSELPGPNGTTLTYDSELAAWKGTHLQKFNGTGGRSLLPAEGAAYEVVVGPFTAADWEAPQSIFIKAVDDDVAEWTNGTIASKRFPGQGGDDVLDTVAMSDRDPRYNRLNGPNVTVFVTDNDYPGVVLSFPYAKSDSGSTEFFYFDERGGSEAQVRVVEEGAATGTTSYGVRLESKPYARVTVNIHYTQSPARWLKHNASDGYLIEYSTFHFTPDTWNKPQQVKIMYHGDDIARPERQFTLRFFHNVTSRNVTGGHAVWGKFPQTAWRPWGQWSPQPTVTPRPTHAPVPAPTWDLCPQVSLEGSYAGSERRLLALYRFVGYDEDGSPYYSTDPIPNNMPTAMPNAPTAMPTVMAMAPLPTATCVEYEVAMSDSYGDGWNGGILHLGSFTATLASGYSATVTFCLEPGVTYSPYVCGDSYPDEISWTVGGLSGGHDSSCTGSSGSFTAEPRVPSSAPTQVVPGNPTRAPVVWEMPKPGKWGLVTGQGQVDGGDPAYEELVFWSEPTFNLTVVDDDVAGVFKTTNKVFLGCDYNGNVMWGDQYSLALTSQPVHSVRFDLSVWSTSSAGLKDPLTHVSLSVLEWGPNDWFQERTVYVKATSNDLAKRSAVVYHQVSSLDPVYGTKIAGQNQGRGPSVGANIVVSRDSTPPPKVLSSNFLDTGGGAKIVFDRDTNQGRLQGQFDCHKFIVGPVVDGFGSKHFCSWPTPRVLSVVFSGDASCLPGEFFYIRNKMLQSTAPNTTLYVVNATGRIFANPTAVAPIVVVNAPATIGLCDDLVVDARLTSGAGGRNMYMTWNVTLPPGLLTAQNQTLKQMTYNLTRVIDEANAANAMFLSVAKAYLSAGEFTFSVEALNWMGKHHSGEVTVRKVNSDPPLVQVKGFGTSTRHYVADDLKLTGAASLPACGSGNAKLVFLWHEVSGYLGAAEVEAMATAQPRTIKIKGGVMKALRLYVFRVTAYLEGSALVNSTALLEVTTLPSELYATVSGGSERMQSRLHAVYLDAAKSYDPDRLNDLSHLNFTWTCRDKATGALCLTAAGATLALETVPTLSIAPSTLPAGEFLISMQLECKADNRTASFVVDLTLAAALVPEVSIAALRKAKVNPNPGTYLQLVGSVKGDPADFGAITFEWEKTKGDDPDPAVTGYESVFSASSRRLSTVLELGALTIGASYTFRLTAVAGDDDATAVAGYSAISVVVNGPPTSGVFTVTPANGVAMTTDFALVCSSWVDDPTDLPLKYAFKSAMGSKAYDSDSALTSEENLAPQSNNPSFDTVLPEGDPEDASSISLVAYISDRLDGTTRITNLATIGSLADNFMLLRRRRLLAGDDSAGDASFGAFMKNLTSSLVAGANAVGDTESTVQTISALASVANSPSGADALDPSSEQELMSGMVGDMTGASATVELTDESMALMMGSMASVSNGQAHRLDPASQDGLLALSVGTVGSPSADGKQIAVLPAASDAACKTMATLLSSDTLLGPGNSNSSNNSAALSSGMNSLAGGTTVGKFSGMAPTDTACPGLLVSASKLDMAETDGAAIAAGNSSFSLPANFSGAVNISEGDVVGTSAQVIADNPHRGASNLELNTDITALSMQVTRADAVDSGAPPDALPVKNLTRPIQIKIPVKSLGSMPGTAANGAGGSPVNLTWGVNVTCPGDWKERFFHTCPTGATVNYTCQLGAPYEIELNCGGSVEHECRFWDVELLFWSTEGCVTVGLVITGPDQGAILCNCTHLTDFGSQLEETIALAAQVVGSIGDLSVGDILKNILVLICLLVIWGAMVFGCIYGRYLDQQEKKDVRPFAVLADEAKAPEKEGIDDVVNYVFKEGSKDDWGQNPDSLRPRAMERRLHKSVLTWKVYQEQTDEIINLNKARVLALYHKIAPPREQTDPSGSPPLEPAGPSFAERLKTKLEPYRAKAALLFSKAAPFLQQYFLGAPPEPPPDDAPDDTVEEKKVSKWKNVRSRYHMNLDVPHLRAIVDKQLGEGTLHGNMLLQWVSFIQSSHRILSIFYSKDKIFTRGNKIMVLATVFLYTMAVNCFLFIFAGNANEGDTPEEVVWNQTQYMIVTNICMAPVMGTIVYLYKKTAPKRPWLEDRWVGAPKHSIPKKIRIAVMVREELLRGERRVRKAAEMSMAGKLLLRDELSKAVQEAENAGEKRLSPQAELKIVMLKQKVEEDCRRATFEARAELAQAQAKMSQVRQAQEAWVQMRIKVLVANPDFPANKPFKSWQKWQFWLVKCVPKIGKPYQLRKLTKAADSKVRDKELATMYLSKEERAIARAELTQLKDFGPGPVGAVKRHFYKKFLHPLDDLKRATARPAYLPVKAVYGVHVAVVLLNLFCSYYTFLFSVLLNRCAGCGPTGSLDDDDVENCATCPDSMRDNADPGQDIATDWLLTLVYTMAFNMCVAAPISAGLTPVLYPVLANAVIRVNWDKFLLSAQDVSDDEDDSEDEMKSPLAPLNKALREGTGILVQVPAKKSLVKAAFNLIQSKEEDAFKAEDLRPAKGYSGDLAGGILAKIKTLQSKQALAKVAPEASEEAKAGEQPACFAGGGVEMSTRDEAAAQAAAVEGSATGGEAEKVASEPESVVEPAGELAAQVAQLEAEAKPLEAKLARVDGDLSRLELDSAREELLDLYQRVANLKGMDARMVSWRVGSPGGSPGGSRDGGSDKSQFVRSIELEPVEKLESKDLEWTCACGSSCVESSRRRHLKQCGLFVESWDAALRNLDKSLRSEPSTYRRAENPLLAKLEDFEASIKAASRSADGSSGLWWTRELLLAALIESGGDSLSAGKKLFHDSAEQAGFYRGEMAFVAEAVQLANALGPSH